MPVSKSFLWEYFIWHLFNIKLFLLWSLVIRFNPRRACIDPIICLKFINLIIHKSIAYIKYQREYFIYFNKLSITNYTIWANSHGHLKFCLYRGSLTFETRTPWPWLIKNLMQICVVTWSKISVKHWIDHPSRIMPLIDFHY